MFCTPELGRMCLYHLWMGQQGTLPWKSCKPAPLEALDLALVQTESCRVAQAHTCAPVTVLGALRTAIVLLRSREWWRTQGHTCPSSQFIPARAQHPIHHPLQSRARSSPLLASVLGSPPANAQPDFSVLFPQQDNVMSALEPHPPQQNRHLLWPVYCLCLALDTQNQKGVPNLLLLSALRWYFHHKTGWVFHYLH